MKKFVLALLLFVAIGSTSQLVFEIRQTTPKCLKGYALLFKRADDKTPTCPKF